MAAFNLSETELGQVFIGMKVPGHSQRQQALGKNCRQGVPRRRAQ
jgi:hypothetical protein